jgi:late competence protein required for DNA uptake (superfamily II DNA/RNA helicase)
MITSGYMSTSVYYCRDCVKVNRYSVEPSPYMPLQMMYKQEQEVHDKQERELRR